MESQDKSLKWHDFISKINWDKVDAKEREKFNKMLEEFRKITNNNLYFESRYKARLSVLMITMIMTVLMNYMNYSNNSIIVFIILFQIIFAAFSGFASWGSSKLLESASIELAGSVEKFMIKYVNGESEDK